MKSSHAFFQRITGGIIMLLLLCPFGVVLAEEGGGHYQLHGDVVPIAEDGIHDPQNDAVNALQPPVEAMKDFPRDARGVINWVEALDNGIIAPRTGLTGNEKMHSVDFDVIFKNTASMPYVRFPHLPHTKWLTCKNCHPAIFLPQRGGNFVTMAAIIEGEFCGVCHGKVAFPPLECNRCHSVARENVGLR
ncbi:c(7)-type cytochrome triheme domain-containing protein [Kaarinaea lacus]